MEKIEETKKTDVRSFDKEYMTEWRREVGYLRKRGIMYAYSKVTREGVTQYKYTKTPKLFQVLYEFYSMVENERRNMDGEVADILKQAGFYMKRGANGEVRFSKLKEASEAELQEVEIPAETEVEDDTE